jgi:Leucine-rich repeat (LRR) protein
MTRKSYFTFINRLILAIVLISLLALLIPASVTVADDEIYFPDSVLREAIRDAIGGGDITQAKLDLLTSFSYGSAILPDVTDLTGMDHCTSLTTLGLVENHIIDISPLSSLTSLTSLSLQNYPWSGNNEISDISPLSGLTSLTYLHLDYNQIGNISPLSSLTSLTRLGLEGNQISDISPLSSLTSLENLGLILNQITGIYALSGLTSLVQLELSGNHISDFTPLSSLTNLSALYLSANHITDISTLPSLTSLNDLNLSINEISDISALSSFTSLTDLELSLNQISDISALSSLTSLENLGLSYNQISDISALTGLTSMNILRLTHNKISNIFPLVANAGLSEGDEVYLIDNPLNADSVNTYIPQLEARGVTVWYYSGEGCFIATAAYGTSTALEIDTLRAFRDEVLMESTVGSQLVEWYYQTSPPVADFISEHDVLRTLVRELLVEPVTWLVEATEAIWGE